MSGNVELFTTRMRKATRKIHSMSDALVNAKFAICEYFPLEVDKLCWSVSGRQICDLGL